MKLLKNDEMLLQVSQLIEYAFNKSRPIIADPVFLSLTAAILNRQGWNLPCRITGISHQITMRPSLRTTSVSAV